MPEDVYTHEPATTSSSTADRSATGSGVLAAIPPPGLVLLAIVAIQLGAAIATHLFLVLGAPGTVAARLIIAALLLIVATRSSVRSLARIFVTHWQLLTVFGLCIAMMNMFFYQSIARIPLGAAVAFEFLGPLGVAAFTSRRPIHFAWIAVAAVGIYLLSPLSGFDFDPLGVIFALLAGVGWAFFIVLSGKVSTRISGNDGLVLGMTVAASTMIPIIVPVAGEMLFNPLILLGAFGVALLSTTIPFTLEFEALKRLPARTYGILVSLEPAVAAMVGAWLLGENIGFQGWIAVMLVVVAAAGITITDNRSGS